MKMFLLDVCNNTAGEVEGDESLDTLYRLVNCDCIDIVVRNICGQCFDIVCDDEGLLKENPQVSAVNMMGRPMLVGNLLFCHHDTEGHLTGLSQADIDHLKDCLYPFSETVLIGGCEYDIG